MRLTAQKTPNLLMALIRSPTQHHSLLQLHKYPPHTNCPFCIQYSVWNNTKPAQTCSFLIIRKYFFYIFIKKKKSTILPPQKNCLNGKNGKNATSFQNRWNLRSDKFNMLLCTDDIKQVLFNMQQKRGHFRGWLTLVLLSRGVGGGAAHNL